MPFKCTTVSSLIHCYWTTRTSSSISISVRSIHSFTRMHECNEPTDRPRYVTPSGVFRGGGTVRCPPFGPTMKSFYRRLYMKRWGFLPFSSKNCKIQQCLMDFCVSKFQKNGRICGFHWTFRSKKCFSFRGASPPLTADQGFCPWTPLGALPPDPCYRLALRARHGPPLPNPKYATGNICCISRLTWRSYSTRYAKLTQQITDLVTSTELRLCIDLAKGSGDPSMRSQRRLSIF